MRRRLTLFKNQLHLNFCVWSCHADFKCESTWLPSHVDSQRMKHIGAFFWFKMIQRPPPPHERGDTVISKSTHYLIDDCETENLDGDLNKLSTITVTLINKGVYRECSQCGLSGKWEGSHTVRWESHLGQWSAQQCKSCAKESRREY